MKPRDVFPLMDTSKTVPLFALSVQLAVPPVLAWNCAIIVRQVTTSELINSAIRTVQTESSPTIPLSLVMTVPTTVSLATVTKLACLAVRMTSER